MPKELIDNELWSLIEPLLPARAPRNRQYAGRKPTPDRAVLTGIVFVLRSGIAWNLLPQEMGCGSGTACWRRLVAWQEAGVWQRIHETLLAELRRRGEIDLSRALVDSSSMPFHTFEARGDVHCTNLKSFRATGATVRNPIGGV